MSPGYQQQTRGNQGEQGNGKEEQEATVASGQEITPPPLVKDQEGTDDTGSPKPWSCNRASLFVKESNSKGKRRLVRFAQEKQAAVNGIMRAPYVEVGWSLPDGSRVNRRGLFDTGADWSIIRRDALTPQELEQMEPTLMQGQGVCKESLPIVGEVWSDLYVGEVLVKNHRFIVVKDMVAALILGVDLWCRLGEMIGLDLSGSKLLIPKFGVELMMFETEHGGDKGQDKKKSSEIKVMAAAEVLIPPWTELFVKCKSQKAVKDRAYLCEPRTLPGRETVSAVFAFVDTKEGEFYTKFANIGDQEVRIKKGEQVGVLKDDTNPAVLNCARAFQNKQGCFDWDSKLGKNLNGDQRKQLRELLREMSGVFYDGGTLPLVQIGIEHKIRVKEDATPMAQRPRRLALDEDQEVREEVEDLIRMKVVRTSNSAWAAPVVCARRANGKLRLALDYRGPNSVSAPANLHPIPRMDDLMDRLGDAKFYSTLDAKAGYHQMPLAEEDCEVTAFVVPWGQYEFDGRTPFGLKGAGYTFQRMMAKILAECNYEEALCYLDDVLVWSTTWDEHLKRLRNVLQKVKNSGLALSFEKCEFGVDEVIFLGTVVHNGMLKMSEKRVEDLRRIERPETVTDLRKAIGAFSFVQQWIPGMAEIAAPLYKMVQGKKYSRLEWNQEADEAFEGLKERVAQAVALRIPNQKKKFTLVTDASGSAVGAMLAQAREDDESALEPVAFYHHALGKAERNYSTTERELLAVVLGVKRFAVYLGRPFDLITDHRALQWLDTLDINDRKGRRARWLEYLQEFDITSIHKAGKSPELSIADFLSRVRADGSVEGGGPEVRQVTVAQVSVPEEVCWKDEPFEVKELIDKQGRDQRVSMLKRHVRAGSVPEKRELIGFPSFERFYLDGRGILRLRFNGGRRNSGAPSGVRARNRIVVPQAMIAKILKSTHEGPMAGHMGQERTWTRARNTFWWKGMKSDVENYVRGCQECGENKYDLKPNKAPVKGPTLPLEPMQVVQTDFMGPFPRATGHPFRYVLQIQDELSRYLRLIPCVNADMQTAADIVFEEWVCLFGFPKTIKSDRGTHFTGEVFKEMCRKAGIDHKFGAPDHHESQGQVERQNQLLLQVRCMCSSAGKVEEWPEAIIRMQLTHNACVSATTGYTPLRVVTGRRARDLECLMEDEELGEEDWWGKFEEHTAARDEVVENTRERTERLRQQRNRKLVKRNKQYIIGDLVRMKRSTAARGLTGGKKLATINSQLYRVAEVYADGWTYRLKPWKRKGREKIRHFDSLVKGYDRAPDLRAVENVNDELEPVQQGQPEKEAAIEVPRTGEDGQGDLGITDEGAVHEVGSDPESDNGEELGSLFDGEDNEGEGLSTDESIPEVESRPVVRTPRPGRVRKGVKTLQVGGKGQSYTSSRARTGGSEEEDQD